MSATAIDDAAVQNNFDLIRREVMLRLDSPPGAEERDGRAFLQAAAQMTSLQNLAGRNPIIVGGVGEAERKHAVVDEILPVNAGEGLREHEPEPEIARRGGGVLPGRALPVILAADDGVASRRLAIGARTRSRCCRRRRR